eukprot:6184005-Pleurochrysis_carterae.AAC.7
MPTKENKKIKLNVGSARVKETSKPAPTSASEGTPVVFIESGCKSVDTSCWASAASSTLDAISSGVTGPLAPD